MTPKLLNSTMQILAHSAAKVSCPMAVKPLSLTTGWQYDVRTQD